jgi:hypothetical protein
MPEPGEANAAVLCEIVERANDRVEQQIGVLHEHVEMPARRAHAELQLEALTRIDECCTPGLVCPLFHAALAHDASKQTRFACVQNVPGVHGFGSRHMSPMTMPWQ